MLYPNIIHSSSIFGSCYLLCILQVNAHALPPLKIGNAAPNKKTGKIIKKHKLASSSRDWCGLGKL